MPRLIRYLAATLVIIALPLVAPNAFYIHLGQVFATTAIAVIGLNLLLGLSGQMSLGHGGFYAIGAYGSAILATTYGWPILPAALAGLALTGVSGLLVGLVALRTRGLHLAVATLAFGAIVSILAQRWAGLTGGPMGLMGVPQIDFGDFALGPRYHFWTCAACLLLVQIGSDYICGSAVGRRLRAIRDSEAFARTIGLNVPVWRTAIFFASAMLAGLGGLLFAHQDGFLSSDAFTVELTISLLIATVIGGLGRSYGPLLGTAIMLAVTEAVASLHEIADFINGAILVGVLTLFPGGAIALLTPRSRRPSASSVVAGSFVMGPGLRAAPLPCQLTVRGLTKSYAGVTALTDAEMTVAPGTIHALIGPNGAGKSTLINLVAGLYRPDAGVILLGKCDVTGLRADQRARLGLVRTFQNLQLINGLDALSNVMLGMARRRGLLADFGAWLLGSGHEAAERAAATQLLDTLGLAAFAGYHPADLSYGHRKLLELARAIAQQPSVLLLDEPVAGLNPQEARAIADVMRRLRDGGVAILLVEHNIEFVMALSDHVTVLDFGHRIADGPPGLVQQDAAVQRAYLGIETPAA